MPKTKAKRVGGRPRSAAPSTYVGFRADAAVMEAIDRLAAAIDIPGLPPVGAKSIAIRQAILAQAAQLGGGK